MASVTADRLRAFLRLPDDVESIWPRCWKRIRGWGLPPGWSWPDWREEARAEGQLAICHALDSFDSSLSDSLEAFLYAKIVNRVWGRHRREWAYGTRRAAEPPNEPWADSTDVLESTWDREVVDRAWDRLKAEDQWVLRRLYWDGWSEVAIADELGKTQAAVSQRKRRALNRLRRAIEEILR